MSFEVLREKEPSCSWLAVFVILVLTALLLAMATAFAYLLVTGKGNNYELGTLLAFEFFVAGVMLVVYAKNFASFREISEEREEGLLW